MRHWRLPRPSVDRFIIDQVDRDRTCERHLPMSTCYLSFTFLPLSPQGISPPQSKTLSTINQTTATMPSVSFIPSQVGSPDEIPLPYTASPLRLLASDIILVIHHLGSVVWLFSPLWPCKSGALDETYPSRQNIWCGVVHVVLVIAQLLFLISLVVCVLCLVPALWVLV